MTRLTVKDQSGKVAGVRAKLLLSLLSGVMLGFSFPPSSLGILACFGLVPILIVLAETPRTRNALGYTYVTMALFHVITLNWTGGYEHGNDPYMMVAGGVTMFFHPLFYFIPIGLFLFVRNRVGESAALFSLPFLWVAYEYSHSLSEWSFPWLTIGNSHSYDLERIQFISITGVLGISFGILLMNVMAYVLFLRLARKEWSPFSIRPIGLAALIIVLYTLPKIHGSALLDRAVTRDGLESGETKEVTVGIVQSNIDPWEKWSGSPGETLGLYLSLTDSLLQKAVPRPDIVLWPETALPFRLLSARNLKYRTELVDSIRERQIALVTGFPHMEVYADSGEAPPSAKIIPSTRQRYDNYNAAAFLQPDTRTIEWYGKMKMVPLAERVPYADLFYSLDFLRWGVGIGGWQIGTDSTVFVENRTGTRFNVVICYESTYPEFVASFVKRGAEYINIITIDSWWGRMSGAFQHSQFAVFRAIENRRWIARCAVGGFSCFIDPFGRQFQKTDLFEQATISRSIERLDEWTFYTLNGEWLARICVLIGGFFVAASFGQQFKNNVRAREWEQS